MPQWHYVYQAYLLLLQWAAVQVGLIGEEFILNPTSKEREESSLQLTVCATKERVMMIEAGGDEIPEDTMINAIKFGFDKCQDIIKFQEEAVSMFGKEKKSARTT